MLILAGLGNPGEKHERNRHNLGFMVVDAIADRFKFGPEKSRFLGLTRQGSIETADGPVNVLILKPQTYMNESGQSVLQASWFFKTPISDVVVFHDELDLAPGRFRMKTGGGAAGHNGLRSIVGCLGADFRRGRLGIGHPGDKDRVLGYVLANFAKADDDWVTALCDACAEAAPLVVAGQDERYQTDVMRLAPAEKADTRQIAKGAPQ